MNAKKGVPSIEDKLLYIRTRRMHLEKWSHNGVVRGGMRLWAGRRNQEFLHYAWLAFLRGFLDINPQDLGKFTFDWLKPSRIFYPFPAKSPILRIFRFDPCPKNLKIPSEDLCTDTIFNTNRYYYIQNLYLPINFPQWGYSCS